MNFSRLFTGALAGTMLASLIAVGGVNADGELGNQLYNCSKIPDGYKITIDGKMDDVWTAAEAQVIDRCDDDAGDPSETTGTIRVLWDDDGYYCFVEVDKHGQDIVAPCVGREANLEIDDDTVKFGFVNGGADQFWMHPGTVEYAYCGMVCGDMDGNLNRYGWYAAYGSDVLKYSIRRTADDKFNAELFVPWVKPMRADVYGAAGVGEGSIVMLDVVIFSHDPEFPSRVSYISWSEYPYCALGASQSFGYVVLSEELDPSEIKTASVETPTDESPVDDETPSGDVTPSADITVNGDVADKEESKKDNNGKKDNSPATLDIASAVAVFAIISFGAVITVKKKHR